MADISKITLPDSSEYNIKDATARSIANGKSTVSVSQTLTSGTEIGSVTVNGTATTLYAPQGGGSVDALTDPEIDEAVEAAFVEPSYAISYVDIYVQNEYIRSLSTDGTKVAGNYAESAHEGDLLTITTDSNWGAQVNRSDTLASVECIEGQGEYIGGHWTRIWTCTMPAFDITISGFYDD